ncbi:MAG: cache domain-containing protein, partial [Candidatus Zixiibacteriota bacterium]
MKSSSKDLVDSSQATEIAQARFPRYRRLRRNTVVITSLVALIPLVILTTINYLQDQEAYRAENRFAISRMLSNTKRTLEFVIEERRSVLSLIINEHPHEELSSDEALAATLRNLKNSFGGFVDLGLIDSSGYQSHYVGPYELKGRNYRDQASFHEVYLRGAYVSDVFMGYRNFPHFVIAFKREKEGENFYILRATLDMELLNQQIYSLDLDRQTDAFIVNQNGIL